VEDDAVVDPLHRRDVALEGGREVRLRLLGRVAGAEAQELEDVTAPVNVMEVSVIFTETVFTSAASAGAAARPTTMSPAAAPAAIALV